MRRFIALALLALLVAIPVAANDPVQIAIAPLDHFLRVKMVNGAIPGAYGLWTLDATGAGVYSATTVPPAAAPTATLKAATPGNIDPGVYTYKVTYLTAGGETTGSAASNTVTVVDKAVAGQIDLTVIPISPYPGTLWREIYRSKDGGPWLLVGNVANNTGTTLTDNAAAGTDAIPATNTAVDTRLSIANSGIATFPGPQILTGDGTAALPSNAFILDPDTGPFREGADSYAISSGGVDRIKLVLTALRLRSSQIIGWTAGSTSGTPDVALKRNATKILEITDGSTGWGSLVLGRVITGSATPTVAATGYGATGSVALGTGASDLAGRILITVAGAGPAASGTATLTFSTTNGAYGGNPPSCVMDLWNNTGTWNARATLRGSSPTTTSVVFNWDNNAVALTAGSIYAIHYNCKGHP